MIQSAGMRVDNFGDEKRSLASENAKRSLSRYDFHGGNYE
jgi:hypothetical protein